MAFIPILVSKFSNFRKSVLNMTDLFSRPATLSSTISDEVTRTEMVSTRRTTEPETTKKTVRIVVEAFVDADLHVKIIAMNPRLSSTTLRGVPTNRKSRRSTKKSRRKLLKELRDVVEAAEALFLVVEEVALFRAARISKLR